MSLDQLFLQIVTNATTTLPIPSSPVIVTAPAAASTLNDLITHIVNQFGTILVIISGLLATPGGIAFFNWLKLGKQRQATQELTGILGQKTLQQDKQIKILAEILYNSLPADKRKILDEAANPILKKADSDLDNFIKALEKLNPELPSTTKAALTRV